MLLYLDLSLQRRFMTPHGSTRNDGVRRKHQECHSPNRTLGGGLASLIQSVIDTTILGWAGENGSIGPSQ